ncbi:hypothetical protein [Ktedonobacter racemifer]|nr:hypothetical protein [Ktedonobacter racemifer]
MMARNFAMNTGKDHYAEELIVIGVLDGKSGGIGGKELKHDIEKCRI